MGWHIATFKRVFWHLPEKKNKKNKKKKKKKTLLIGMLAQILSDSVTNFRTSILGFYYFKFGLMMAFTWTDEIAEVPWS